MQPSAFTIKSNSGVLNQLTTMVNVVVPNTKNAYQVKAIWDTGATASVITENVVKSLGLLATGDASRTYSKWYGFTTYLYC